MSKPEPGFTFICRHHDGTLVKMRITDGVTVNDLLEAFQDFMYGCGYRLKGDIEVVEREEDSE